MKCEECTRSAAEEWHGYRLGCKGCDARAISRGPQFFFARRAQRGTPEGDAARDEYRQVLQQCGLTHDQVKAAAVGDALNKVAT